MDMDYQTANVTIVGWAENIKKKKRAKRKKRGGGEKYIKKGNKAKQKKYRKKYLHKD